MITIEKEPRLYKEVLDLGLCDFEDTSNLTHEQWLEKRRLGIGGSDAGSIMGLNKYGTPLTVYMDKIGKKKQKTGEALQWGNILEEPIRAKTAQEFGCIIQKPEGTFTGGLIEHARANLDGIIKTGEQGITIAGDTVKGLGGWECKTTRRGEGFTDDEVPDSYYAQVQHYMGVTGLKWFVLTVFYTSDYSHRHYIIKKNDYFVSDLTFAEAKFWCDYVKKGIPPAPCGFPAEMEAIDDMAQGTGGEVVLPSSCLEVIQKERALDAQIKVLLQEQNTYKEQIKLALLKDIPPQETTTSIKASCAGYKVNYLFMTTKRVDIMALKKAGLYDKYTYSQETRQLRITQGKEEKR